MSRTISETELVYKVQRERVQQVINGLYGLARWLEATPEIHPYLDLYKSSSVDFDCFVEADDFKAAAKVIGACTKDYGDYYFTLEKDFGEGQVKMKVQTSRGNVCTKRVVGKKTVTIPARPATEGHTYEEDIVEYDCPESLLKP